ncbi:hypothetical protein HUJ04_007612 [Dendroctonus ponderosae]|nr:hypothetical protein HUJ04_007612 [Dendroctonus ponderosae]
MILLMQFSVHFWCSENNGFALSQYKTQMEESESKKADLLYSLHFFGVRYKISFGTKFWYPVMTWPDLSLHLIGQANCYFAFYNKQLPLCIPRMLPLLVRHDNCNAKIRKSDFHSPTDQRLFTIQCQSIMTSHAYTSDKFHSSVDEHDGVKLGNIY